MIFVTGDTHGDVHRLNMNNFPIQKEMTKDDYVIILGDFGLVWEQEESKEEAYWLNWLNNKNFTTLFIDGNHENFDRLSTYPYSYWRKGQNLAQYIRPTVIHLLRGYVYTLDNYKCLSLGGARSHDISDGIFDSKDPVPKSATSFRINHLSWWKEEFPSDTELLRADCQLALNHNQVDFIFTHEAPASTAARLGYHKPDHFAQYLQKVKETTYYKNWYYGHYHTPLYFPDERTQCVYENIIQIA